MTCLIGSKRVPQPRHGGVEIVPRTLVIGIGPEHGGEDISWPESVTVQQKETEKRFDLRRRKVSDRHSVVIGAEATEEKNSQH